MTATLESTDSPDTPQQKRRWRIPPSWRTRRDLFPPDTTWGAVLRGTRIGFVLVWALALYVVWRRDGVPFDAQTQLLWIGLGLLAFCVGRHPIWLLWVALDIAPFAAALLLYDRLRGFSYQVGFPTWWHPQVAIDKVLGFGHVPTIWLQEHLKMAHVQWYDVLICVTYSSYFFVPYVTAGALWLRGRTNFYRWSLRYVALSFLCYALFVLLPSAPPWAAARCTATQVANQPANPPCLGYDPRYVPNGGLLGHFTTHQPGANPWVENLVWRAWGDLHIKYFAGIIQKGHEYFDPVAAIPSLHVGATTMFAIFFWKKVPTWLRPALVAYPLLMSFTLVYGAEHYVTDCIAGALAAFGVHVAANRIERWKAARDAPDTLESPPDEETPCQTGSVQETTPSST